jgi:tetratricopeptide (TPR) repeat protein
LRAILHFTELPREVTPGESALVIGPEQLALTWSEALDITDRRIPEHAARRLWRMSRGALEPFLIDFHRKLRLPPPLRPSPHGFHSVPTEAATATSVLLDAMLHRGCWPEALEFAHRGAPHRLPEVLARGWEQLWARGAQERVYLALADAPPEIAGSPDVLYWRMLAALDIGREGEVLPQAEAALAKGDFPDLEALCAEARLRAGDIEESVTRAERCATRAPSPTTLYVYGRAVGVRGPDGLVALEGALRMAEAAGGRYWMGQVAVALAARLTCVGRYRASRHWSEWGLAQHGGEQPRNEPQRLRLLNEWAFARLLIGDTAGLDSTLRPEVRYLDEVGRARSEVLRGTLADVLLSEGRVGEAIDLYREIWAHRPRRHLGASANLYVNALLHAGDAPEALRVAEKAVELTKGLPPLYRRRALLAHGMAVWAVDPARAVPVLRGAMEALTEALLAPRLAQAGLFLASALLALRDEAGARQAIQAAKSGVDELGQTGLAYLAGPDDLFAPVLAFCRPPQAPLELRFLGRTEVRLRGQRISIRPRLADFLAVLALHPQGLTGEQLAAAIYGDRGSPEVCKTEISRLRQIIPLTSRPYRLAVDVWADFIEVERLLGAGRLADALAFYRGPLLPASEAPDIEQIRTRLEVAIRRAALAEQSSEPLWRLAEQLEDDLEVWEAVLEYLPPTDHRRPLAEARVLALRVD